MYGFLDFPAEIRNLIYKVLYEAPHLTITPDWLDLDCYRLCSSKVTKFSASVSFLRTCKQINIEASTILYGRNVFVFEDPESKQDRLRGPSGQFYIPTGGLANMHSFLKVIGPRNRLQLWHVKLLILYWDIVYDSKGAPYPCGPGINSEDRSFADGLELLADGNHLSALEIGFELVALQDIPFVWCRFFRKKSQSRVLRALLKFNGLKSFHLDAGFVRATVIELGAEHTDPMVLCGKIDGRHEAGCYDQAISKLNGRPLREVYPKVTTAMKRYIKMAKQMEAQRVRPAILTRSRRLRNELLSA